MYVPEDRELEVFVEQSNAIEGIYEGPGHPLYDDHLAAARFVAERPLGTSLSPRIVHARVMASEPKSWPGGYRTVNVRVGPFLKAPWEQLPQLMRRLLDRVEARYSEGGPFSEDEAWNLHHELEHIHPFRDGNGRTGRLWLNALLLSSGHEWLTVFERSRQSYYNSIREWEARNARY